ncbi:anaphase-promoting complex subunit 4-like [Asterias rubens]|uniref:anaphase-promoting complex subunit 4-like n=1 Tax=Asterias rubens TaxID=7604 RepID=UPI00145598C7|nr:anaphase-promoting complex subunit 4-like [Asterias rubens]
MQNAFRQLEERSLSAEVLHMCWSPMMDLIALANVNCEVVLQRLTWQKQPVWVLPAPPASDDINQNVNTLAWRPDGKVLAVGYTSGQMLLCSVENADVLHTVTLTSAITCMQWVAARDLTEESKGSDRDLFEDGADIFLPKLPPLAKLHSAKVFAEDNVEDAKRLKGQKRLNVLVVGLNEGKIQLYAYGIAAIGEVDMSQVSQQSHSTKEMTCGRITTATLSRDLCSLSLVMESRVDQDPNPTVHLLSLDCVLISSRREELTKFAIQSSKIFTFLEYLSATLRSVSEAREDILLEIETKLTKYAEQKKTAGSVRDELLQLLLWGRASPELQAFLLHELTEKGMKKLGQSVENSYSNIQKLVLKHIHSVGRSLVYHLSELKGMSLWYDKYGVIGLSPPAIQDAIGAVGSFMLKASELLQVLDTSLKNFKAFFRWLYVVMMRLSEEPVPNALNKVRQRDINFIADFLAENFAEDIGGSHQLEKQSGFTLERVGQYLKREDLQFPLTSSVNVESWQSCISTSPNLNSSQLVYKHQPHKSLVQLFESMKESIYTALSKPAVAVGGSIRCCDLLPLYTPDTPKESSEVHQPLTVSKYCHTEMPCFYTVLMMHQAPTQVIYLIRQPNHQAGAQYEAGVICLYFSVLGASNANDSTASQYSNRCNQHEVLDAAFFDDHTLTVLLQEQWSGPDSVAVVCQLPLGPLADHTFLPLTSQDVPLDQRPQISKVDAGLYVSHCRRLDNIKASIFAVSGSRKVSCVLFCNRRRVRLFDMDAEDDGEDESLSERSLLDASNVGIEETRQDESDSNKENIELPH